MLKITVSTEAEKEEILRQSEYVHDFMVEIPYRTWYGKKKYKYCSLDSRECGTLMHLYMAPEFIEVVPISIENETA
ncbi:MAG: hypothetical protein WC979_02445 [Candidatus Pacearchaeota archaeon]|jgi:hypothetical protein|nr:hypothetical protein [Clostridia bacterium]